MPQFFIKSSQLKGNECIIEGGDFVHLMKVRRVRPGDRINVRTEEGRLCAAVVRNLSDNSLVADIVETGGIEEEPLHLTVCVSLLKGRLFDDVIKKLVETGASTIVPVITERTVPDISDKEKKGERWRKISLEAAKQSMRAVVPAVLKPMRFADVISGIDPAIKIIAHTGDNGRNLRDCMRGVNASSDAAVLIGPEGGFTDGEINSACGNGWTAVRFGYSCMRADTAALIIPAILIYEWSILHEAQGKR